ncbi:uncharacterized protein Z519_09989 [Cladophialophora bantiana CBS 173.52]|uniref:DASH complex subunit DAM1 n=1 Tax=Cladophialophora bantiana (strain ATCC 10958 / CBS 173.52 / CDC B-1940 / NIH 8579) TaxID=1442370 RepID=A0A0D2FRA5_CLAB1|nr:uncharacterized protein Z519_09989 [Cladophialophora bantiana CBS 173.52]KIW89137.1 hypothetical protein Z519_09989 [Cladophialophora bantiana CBS 173.52]
MPVGTRSRSPASRPTTPLRPSSRSSFRASVHQNNGIFTGPGMPLDSLEPQFAELSDSMADLEANLMHLQLMHESLSRFGESFASFLYGLNMNAFVVDFPEAPITESIKRWQKRQQGGLGNPDDQSTTIQNSPPTGSGGVGDGNGDATFMTTADASFASLKATPRRKSMAPSVTPGTSSTMKQSNLSTGRGGATAGRGRGGSAGNRGSRGSGLPRGRARGSK